MPVAGSRPAALGGDPLRTPTDGRHDRRRRTAAPSGPRRSAAAAGRTRPRWSVRARPRPGRRCAAPPRPRRRRRPGPASTPGRPGRPRPSGPATRVHRLDPDLALGQEPDRPFRPAHRRPRDHHEVEVAVVVERERPRRRRAGRARAPRPWTRQRHRLTTPITSAAITRHFQVSRCPARTCRSSALEQFVDGVEQAVDVVVARALAHEPDPPGTAGELAEAAGRPRCRAPRAGAPQRRPRRRRRARRTRSGAAAGGRPGRAASRRGPGRGSWNSSTDLGVARPAGLERPPRAPCAAPRAGPIRA